MPDPTCLVDGCDDPPKVRQRCQKHYHEWWRRNRRPLLPRCSQDDCDKEVTALGLCPMHYCRKVRHGDPTIARWPVDRWALFCAKVQIGPVRSDGTRCLLWIGGAQDGGYGRFKGDEPGSSIPAHRWLYERLVGPIPDGWHLHHEVCGEPSCVAPDHLVPLDVVEHAKEHARLKGRPTECKWGHPYTDENAYVDPNGGIRCRQCNRDRNRKRYGSNPARYKKP